MSLGVAAGIAIGGYWLVVRSSPEVGIKNLQASADAPRTDGSRAGKRDHATLSLATTGELGTLPPTSLVATTPTATDDALTASLRATLEKPGAVENEAMLTFANKAAMKRFLQRAKGLGLDVMATLDGLNAVRVRYAKLSSLHDLLSGPTADQPTVDANLWLTVPRLPKEDVNNQGGTVATGDGMLKSIGATGDRSQWGKAITVAVLDTGIEAHPTFGAEQVTHVDLVADGSAMHSHGTSVASLIAGEDERVPGVAPAAHLLDIRVANEKGISVSSLLAQGIIEATNRGAQVINISMGSSSDSQLLRNAVAYATQRNVIIVAAAGNERQDQLAMPAGIPAVISVGSVDAKGKQASFSNSGAGLDIAAPGVGLTTAWGTNMAARVSGTSQSSAIVAGAVAAYLSRGMSYRDVLRQLQADARATGAPPNQVGSGVLYLRSMW